jgi:release factor glutamine methyltransferase
VVKLQSSNQKTFGELLQAGEEALRSTSSSARLDSEVLLAHLLGVSRSGVIARLRDPSDGDINERFAALINRRGRGEPVAYITGEREFFGLSFLVNPAVLVPRPETELVVEEALKFLKGRGATHILDLGTGSGCIAVALVHELKRAGCGSLRCDAVDRSADALKVAQENASRLRVQDYIHFVRSDWCANRAELSPPYDCIVANPPYVSTDEKTPVELTFEPQGALFSGEQGLSDTRRILHEAVPLLAPGGLLLCEVGAGKRALLQPLVEPYEKQCAVTYLGDTSEADRFCVLALRLRG